MMKRFYRNPANVEAILGILVSDPTDEDQIAKASTELTVGIEIYEIYSRARFRALAPDWRGDVDAILLAALQSGDFTTSPKINGAVRIVKQATVFTDSDKLPVGGYLLRLLSLPRDPGSLLIRIYEDDPHATYEAAWAVFHCQCPDVSKRKFNRMLERAREDGRVPPARRGAPKKSGTTEK